MSMDFLRRPMRCSRLEKNINNFIREKINNKNSILEYISTNTLTGISLAKNG